MLNVNYFKTFFKDKSNLLFVSILLLAVFLRFYRLPEMANFDFDQQYASNFAYTVIRDFPIQLIGQGLSVEGLFMGPLYFYYLVPFFFLFKLHPIGGYVGSVIVGLTIIATYYFITKELFGKTAALISAFLRSVFYVSLNNDWNMAPAYASELAVLATWWCFYRYWKKDLKYLPLLAFVFGLYTSVHPLLFAFYFVFLILLIIRRTLPNFKTITVSVITFLVPVSPLIVFEYLHEFWEVKKLIALFTTSGSESIGFDRFSSYATFVFSEPYNVLHLTYIPKQIFQIIFFAVIFIVAVKGFGFWKEKFHLVVLFLTFVTFLIYYNFFPTHVPEYYFLALASLTLLYLSAILGWFSKNRISIVILALILLNISIFNMKELVTKKWSNQSQITLHHKDFIVKEIVKRQPENQEFYVSYISQLGWNFGFDYLFKLYGKVPQTREAKQPIYTIVMPISLSPGSIDVSSGNIGLILPD